MKIGILARPGRKNGAERLLEVARERGHTARIIDYTVCYAVVEKNKTQIYYGGEPLEDYDAIIPRISISSQSFGSAIIRQFEVMNVFSTTGSLGFIRARDKLRSMQLLSRRGIDIPKTAFARNAKDADAIMELVGGVPVVIKIARGSQGVGVVLAETRSAGRAIMQAFYSQGVELLVQEFIKEASGTDIRVFVIDGKVVGSMKRTSQDDFRSNVHLGGTTEAVELTRKERNLSIKAAQVMNLPIAGIDLLRSEKGPLVMEVNAFPMFAGIEAATGQDIAAEVIKYVEQSVTKKPKRDRVGV